MEIRSVLGLSTSHITLETSINIPRLQDLTAHPYAEGFFIFIPDDINSCELPSDLKKCMNFAKDHGCKWLNLDRDAEEIKELPIYDWEKSTHEADTDKNKESMELD